MYWLFLLNLRSLDICAFRGVLSMTVTHMKLKCRYNHKPSGRVFLVSTRDSINDFITWGKYCYIPFIVLVSSLFIWGPTIEFSLVGLILPSLSFQAIFIHPWLLLRKDHFYLLPLSPGFCLSSSVE